MKDYWLAKLISEVGEVDSRKRLQKAVYLLQVSGCPLQCDYILHYYGPYSFELAELINELDSVGVITEEEQPAGIGSRYTSSIKQEGKEMLKEFGETETGTKLKRPLSKFISEFQELNKVDLRKLELAATTAFFYDDDWEVAQEETAKFKKVHVDDAKLKEAVELAKKCIASE